MEINADVLRTAIVMIRRATCTGEEAAPVAITLEVLGREYKRLTEEPRVGDNPDTAE